MRTAVCAVLVLLCAQSAWAEEEAATPTIAQKAVCDEHQRVDKTKLAVELLQKNNAPISAVLWAQNTPSRPPAMDPLGYLVVNGRQSCDEGVDCGDTGKTRLQRTTLDFIAFLKDAANVDRRSGAYAYQGPEVVRDNAQVKHAILEFFRNPDYQITCLPQASDPKKKEADIDVRVRGTASDLYAIQGSDAFKAADKATVSYTQDDVKHKRLRVGSGVVGVGFRLWDEPLWGPEGATGHINVVPYLGMASNITKASGSKADVTTNTRQAGLMFYGYTNRPLPYYWTLRPDLLWNLRDQSRLFTTSIGYVPIVLNHVNSTREFAGRYWFQWIAAGRFIHGHYTTLGERKPEDGRDFDRLGGDVGFQFDYTGTTLPWTWKVTESYLRGWNGPYKNLSQLKSVLTVSLDEKKLIGIDLTYTNGRDPLTTEKDKSWKIGLGLKY